MSNQMAEATNLRPRAGRPTREQARLRVEQLLDRSLEMFLETGFELTTVEAIAASVGMTKRTVYARFKDKRALFRATVLRAIEHWSVSTETLRAAENESLEDSLAAFTRIRLESALSATGVKLTQIINAEAYRFPEITQWAFEQGTQPALLHLADLLRRHAPEGSLDRAKSEELARIYITMVSGPAHGAAMGSVFTPEVIEHRIALYVRLFLGGLHSCLSTPADQMVSKPS